MRNKIALLLVGLFTCAVGREDNVYYQYVSLLGLSNLHSCN